MVNLAVKYKRLLKYYRAVSKFKVNLVGKLQRYTVRMLSLWQDISFIVRWKHAINMIIYTQEELRSCNGSGIGAANSVKIPLTFAGCNKGYGGLSTHLWIIQVGPMKPFLRTRQFPSQGPFVPHPYIIKSPMSFWPSMGPSKAILVVCISIFEQRYIL